MADALVSPLFQTILGNFNNLALEELGLSGALKTEMEKLGSPLSTINAVLLDAEQMQRKSEAVKVWLRKLKDVAHDADDLLDQFAIEAQRRRLPRELKKNRVRYFFSLKNPLVFRVMMSHKLKNVREKLDAIASYRNRFHLREVVMQPEADNLDWKQTHSFVSESQICGRDEEKEQLINNLLTNASELSVHAICGMRGLGKTTLAQLVYNDGRIGKHFELRIWVRVSDDFDVRRLTRAMIESIECCPCDIRELDRLQRRLQEKLNGRSFLLVLDDVWDEDNDKWDNLKDALRCGAQGSAVVTTTCNERIARMMATAPIHHMGILSPNDSWSLFERLAFDSGRRSEDYARLEVIGREIVDKCGGVPLAIKAMGSLMRFKRSESEWSSIKESDMWDLAGILPPLKSSYDHLLPHLKQCFTFCCIFPKDYVMEKETLIQLWMANGFFSCKGQMDLHDMGVEIFNELVWRSFFQDIKEDIYGNITCKMIGFAHDLAQSIMAEECCLIEHGVRLEAFRKARHIALSATTINGKELLQSIRSFLILHHKSFNVYFEGIPHLGIFKHSRALKIHWHFSLASIGNLKHLRYLDVSDDLSIETLPESVSCLYNLQTLNLRNCRSLKKLPEHMNRMKNLIYLEISGCDNLRCMPNGMGQLTCLRKLSMFIVGKKKGCQVEELKELKLVGELRIRNLDNVKSSTDAKSANLIMKNDLRSLSLCWGENNNSNVEEVLNGFEPYSDLKRLEIDNYQGFNFAGWMSLPNLVEIRLINCHRCEYLPPFGRLQFLKKLYLGGMDAVKYIDKDMNGKHGEISFPLLEELSFIFMGSLEKWATSTCGITICPRLTELDVFGCSKCLELPHLPSVEQLTVESSNGMLLGSVVNFNNFNTLKHLCIKGIDDLMAFPDGMMQNLIVLRNLKIWDMPSLKYLSGQLNNLSALQFLQLRNCPQLESLWDGRCNLKSLDRLEIENCSIVSFPNNELCDLSSLRRLTIQWCSKFASLSGELKYLSALEELRFQRCPKLNSLPESIQRLTALRKLHIMSCEGFSYLPDQISGLSSLSSMCISFCPKLKSLPDGMENLASVSSMHLLYY